MKHALIAALLALVCAGAHATGTPKPGAPHATAASGSKSSSIAGAEASAQTIDYYDGGHSYALFNAMRAAPMPATTCPDHKNHIVSILFGVVAVDFSTAGTDHDCLDKILNAVYKVPPPPKLPTTGQIHPAGYVVVDSAGSDCAGPAPAAGQSVMSSSATAVPPGKNGPPGTSSATAKDRRAPAPKLQPVANVNGRGGCKK